MNSICMFQMQFGILYVYTYTYTYMYTTGILQDDSMYRAVLKSIWPYTKTRMARVERVHGEQWMHSYERYMASYDLERPRKTLLLFEIVQTGSVKIMF